MFDPFLGSLNIRCRIIIGIQSGTIILTTTHLGSRDESSDLEFAGSGSVIFFAGGLEFRGRLR